MTENWPNLFIVGTSRAGTTSIYNYLKEIPEIYLAPKGGPYYFFPDSFGNESIKKKYLELFDGVKNEKIRIEYAGYLYHHDSAKWIYETIPDGKILICIRDPVERAFSLYLGAMRSNDEIIPFSEAFEKNMYPIDEKTEFYNHYIKGGLYYKHVKDFIDIFGKDRIKIIIFEEFTANTKKSFKEILEFIGCNSKIPENVGTVYNAYAEPLGTTGNFLLKNKTIKKIAKKILPGKSSLALLRILTNKRGEKPEMLDKHRKKLEEIYFEDSRKLSELLGKNLPWSFLDR